MKTVKCQFPGYENRRHMPILTAIAGGGYFDGKPGVAVSFELPDGSMVTNIFPLSQISLVVDAVETDLEMREAAAAASAKTPSAN